MTQFDGSVNMLRRSVVALAALLVLGLSALAAQGSHVHAGQVDAKKNVSWSKRKTGWSTTTT